LRLFLLAALVASAAPAAVLSQTAQRPPAPSKAPAQTQIKAQRLTPERAFASPDLTGPTARGVAVSPDGRLVTYLRAKPENQQVLDLWAAPVDGGEPRRLVDADALSTGAALSEAEIARRERMRISSRGVVSYSWDEQGRRLLVPVDGDLWVAEAATGQTRRLTQTPGDEIDAKVSPQGRFVSYVRDANLYLQPLDGGPERALTTGGGGVLSYGVAEFIAQEELDRDTGYWWSPDESRVAYTRVDESGVDVIPRFDIGPKGTTVVEQRYPRAGRPNARVDLLIANLAGGAPVPVDLGTNADIYLARVDWSKDGRTLYVQRLSRDQERLDLLAVDPATGRSRTILTETSRHWINLNNDFRALSDGGFLWASERSGYNHLYRYRPDGTLAAQLTSGDWPVRGVSGLDERGGRVFFLASTDDPTQQHLYSADFARPAAPRRITSGQGQWSATVASGGFVGTYADPRTPPNTALYSLDGRRLRWIEENALRPGHPFFPFAARLPTREFGSLQGPSGDRLHYELIKPADFNPARRYPVIVQTYGGPHVQTVRRGWTGADPMLWTDKGYLIFRLDNRGSSNRGVAFEAALDQRMGVPEIEDQIAGARWLARQRFVDPARIGITGWSYGGFAALMALTDPANPFKAGMAGAPPTEWGLYDTGYTERYMGMPSENVAGYAASDVLNRLDRLKPGSLLLVHGMADDNVLFANTTRVMEALQARAIPFELMLYPGQRHGIRGEKLQLHRWRTTADFFDRKLQPKEAP
jgi:dipeptidyl-peptidase-4